MAITSFYFLCFFAALLLLYYSIPRRFQWGFLLLCSVIYLLLAGQGALILYPFVSIAACHTGTRLLAVNIGILFALKYVNFLINTADGVVHLLGGPKDLISGVDFLVPLGVSFYTFSLLGYVIDVYYGLAAHQENGLKLALYGLYFPNLISGPILKYREHADQFFAPHAFDYRQVTRGLQRMVWGFFKKLVISERLGVLVNTVYGSCESYNGAYIWVATACYAFIRIFPAVWISCWDCRRALALCCRKTFRRPSFQKAWRSTGADGTLRWESG